VTDNETSGTKTADSALPVWFLAHGSPMLAVQHTPYTRALAVLQDTLPRPAAIAVVSAHWETRGAIRVTGARRPETMHDFGGFDRSLSEIAYPAPGAPELASEIVTMVGRGGLAASLDTSRGLDHGAWVPLRWSFPDATVPVVQISLPFPASSANLLQLGRALAPLRRRGVLLLASGGIVHNLRIVTLENDDAPVPGWASEFDGWVADRLEALEIEALADYRGRAPHASLAVPTAEHFEPLLVALGAAELADRVTTLFEGFQYGTLSLRSISLARP
jgi:4,5-DOPA dioxygenase extradiol